MSDIWAELKKVITWVATNAASYLAVGSFVLYLLGYLVIRFHLTVWGIGTDLSVVDERYVFAGAKFLVYVFSTIPILVLLGLVVWFIGLVLTLAIKLLALLVNRIRGKKEPEVIQSIQNIWNASLFFLSFPQDIFRERKFRTSALLGILVSVIMIQFIMRQCFLFTELLISPSLPEEPWWLRAIILDPSGHKQYYYFTVLVGFTLLSGSMLLTVWFLKSNESRFLRILLTLLVAIQILFLPVNYGILVFDKTAPRVLALSPDQPLTPCGGKCTQDCQEAWLIWEGKDGMTYFVRRFKPETPQSQNESQTIATRSQTESRSIVTLPRADVKKTEITSYDSLLNKLSNKPGCTP